MSRDVGKLVEPFRSAIKDILEKANDAGIPAFVTNTTRTLAEQRRLVEEGKSKTMNSKHLTGKAADIAFQINGKLSYDKKLYWRLYEITKNVSYVVWPYEDYGWHWDMPHHEYKKDKIVYDNDMLLKDCQKKVRELNTEIGRVTEDRDKLNDILEKERSGHLETFDKLQACEKEREEIANEKRRAVKLFSIIRNFFA